MKNEGLKILGLMIQGLKEKSEKRGMYKVPQSGMDPPKAGERFALIKSELELQNKNDLPPKTVVL